MTLGRPCRQNDLMYRDIQSSPQFNWQGCAGIHLLLLVLSFFALLGSCVSSSAVTRARSPDGSLMATVVEVNGGATTDFAYRVDVARFWPLGWGRSVARFYGAVRSDCAYGVNIRWLDNERLLISYLQADQASARPRATVLGRAVRVIMRKGVVDRAAPCGGMEYAQQGKVATYP